MKSASRRSLALLTATVAAAITLVGCGSSGESSKGSGDGPTVVATTTQVADFARNVIGENGTVVQLLPANADAHDYEPTSDDLKSVTDADVILANGAHLDDWVADLKKSAESDAPIVETSKGITLAEGGEHDHHGDEADAHDGDEADHDHDAEHAHDGDEADHDHNHGERIPTCGWTPPTRR